MRRPGQSLRWGARWGPGRAVPGLSICALLVARAGGHTGLCRVAGVPTVGAALLRCPRPAGQGWLWEVCEPSAPPRRRPRALPRPPRWAGRHWLWGGTGMCSCVSCAGAGRADGMGQGILSSSGFFISFWGDTWGTFLGPALESPAATGHCGVGGA